MPHSDGVRAITLSAAEILGVADRVGSISIGKDATLILADGDILETETNVEAAFIQGRPFRESHVPTEAMSYEARLQLPRHDKSDPAILKSQYRRLSRDWHPDRWVGFPQYRPAITRIFELLNDAYHTLGA